MALFLLSGLELELYSVHEYLYVFWWADSIHGNRSLRHNLGLSSQVFVRVSLRLDRVCINKSRLLHIWARMYQRAIQKPFAWAEENKVEEKENEAVLARVHVHASLTKHLRRILQSSCGISKSGENPPTAARIWSRTNPLWASFCAIRWASNATAYQLPRFLLAEERTADGKSRRFVLVCRKALSTGPSNSRADSQFRHRGLLRWINCSDLVKRQNVVLFYPQLTEALKIVKINYVVMNLLANGHKKDSKLPPEFDFSSHRYFPIIKQQ